MARADEATRFKPGQSGNPKGRPKGSRRWRYALRRMRPPRDLDRRHHLETAADESAACTPLHWPVVEGGLRRPQREVRGREISHGTSQWRRVRNPATKQHERDKGGPIWTQSFI
jgi:hypothetical protein